METWIELNRKCGLSAEYEITKSYPLSYMNALIHQASDDTGIPIHDLKETFGEYCVPDLFRLYESYLDPSWKTYEVLKNTEDVFHGAVRKLNSTAKPPVLTVSEIGDKVLVIDYNSPRRMGALAVGIIRGIAKYYHESDQLVIIPKTDPDA